MKFKVGDVVELNSGGPQMTVSTYLTDMMKSMMQLKKEQNYAVCEWFDENKEVQKRPFDEDMLKTV